MGRTLIFPPFRFEPEEARLLRDGRPVALRLKARETLRALTARPGHLIGKEELLDLVWPDVAVGDVVLKVCIRELRAALGDDARSPTFIETVHRVGYRFIAPLLEAEDGDADPVSPTDRAMVGRDAERERLLRAFAEAASGQRRVVLVTGEPGIGKTTLLDAFLTRAGVLRRAKSGPANWWVVRGQCVEHVGTVEAFLPVLEGLTRLARDSGGERLTRLLRDHAPSWLLQMPGVVSASEREAIQREYASASHERMLRELVVGLEALCGESPIVLVIEDLHWSDRSTIDLLAALARRPEPARLLVVATWRPADPGAGADPVAALVQELCRHRLASEVRLDRLGAAAVESYLAARFGAVAAARLAPLVHRYSDGNPLFMVNAAELLLERGWVVPREGGIAIQGEAAGEADTAVALREIELELPRSLRELIRAQIEMAGEREAAMLEVAAVVGLEFTDHAVAAGLGWSATEVGELCAAALRRGLLRSRGSDEWPDGARVRRFGFTHGLHRDAFLVRLTAPRRVRVHGAVAERLAVAFGEESAAVAAELAMHFERAHLPARAVEFLRVAGREAARRHGAQEAIQSFERALALLEGLPADATRDTAELETRLELGVQLINTRGFGAPEVEATYERAMALCTRLGTTSRRFAVLEGLHSYHAVRRDLQTAHSLAQQMLEIAEAGRVPAELLEAHHTLGTTALRLGDFAEAHRHLETALLHYAEVGPDHAYEHSGHDPRVCCQGYLAIALWYAAKPDAALAAAQAALAHAVVVAHPYSISLARLQLAWVHCLRREPAEVGRVVATALGEAVERGFAYSTAMALLFSGWAQAFAGDLEAGLPQLAQGDAVCRAIGAGVGRLEYLTFVADACAAHGRVEQGLPAIEEALAIVAASGERYGEAELYRLRGTLLLAAGKHRPAAGDFRRALDLARACGARAIELRSAECLRAGASRR